MRARELIRRVSNGAWLDRVVATSLGAALLLAPDTPAGAAGPVAIVSLEGCTMRVETGRGRRVFPVAVGRLLPDGSEPIKGRFYTGPDPADERFYTVARRAPAYLGGLPFLRLDRRSGGEAGSAAAEPRFGIHGPVTPTLIWGRVSAGCIRMRPQDLQWVFSFARSHPGLEIRILEHLDRVGEQPVAPDRGSPHRPDCPEAGLGLRRLRRAELGEHLHDRVCGGVDHWWVFELKGGETLRARIQQAGFLRMELYGIRGISTVAAGRFGFDHTVPPADANRGDRYLRVTPGPGARPGAVFPYTMQLVVEGKPH